MKAKRIFRVASAIFSIAMTIHAQTPPPNDNFADRIRLEGPSADFVATGFGATIETGDPTSEALILIIKPNSGVWNDADKGSLWWSWTADFSGFAVISTTSITNQTVWPELDVFEGDALGDFVYDNRLAGMQVSPWINLTGFSFQAGKKYSIAFIGDSQTNISYEFHFEASPMPIIVEQPQSETIRVGGAHAFWVLAPMCGTNGNVRWQHNGVNIPGATGPTYQVNNATAADAGEYRAIVNILKQSAMTTSETAILTVEGADTQPELRVRYIQGTTNRFAIRPLGETNQYYRIDFSSDFAFDHTLLVPGGVAPIEFLGHGVEAPFNPGTGAISFLRAVRAGDLKQTCVENLKRVNFAKRFYSQFWKLPPGAATSINEVETHFLGSQNAVCPLGGAITYNAVDTPPVCSISGHRF